MRGVVVFACLLALAAALPRRVPEESRDDDSDVRDTELFVVPLERQQPRRPVLTFDLADELAPPPAFDHPFFRFSPWGAAPAAPPSAQDDQVDDFMTQMQEMLKEMRKQLTEMLHHSHAAGFPDDTGVIDTKTGADDLPQNKTTSTTKVIDGHVVTVNETTYSSGDDNIGAVFRIKIVEVKPSETPDVETEGDVKPVEPEGEDKSGEPTDVKTEGPKAEHEPTTSKSELVEDEHEHEETNEIPNQKVVREWSPEDNEIDQSGEEYLVDEFKPSKKANYYDLSGDTRVNDYLSDRGQSQELVMIEPDAELIDGGANTNAHSYYHYDRLTAPYH